MSARDADEVHVSRFQHLLGKGRVLDIADRDDRDLHDLADVRRQVALPALLEIVRLDDGRAGVIGAAADIQAADPQGLQIFGLRDGVLVRDAVVQIVIAVDADGDREFRPAEGLDAHDDLGHETHPALKAPAVLVRALVGVRRQELADQVAVRRVDLDAVEAGLLGDDRAGDEFSHHGFHFIGGERAGLLADHLAGYVRCGDGLLPADQAAGGLVAGVVQLHEDLRVIGVHSLHESRELRDHMRVRDAQLIGRAHAGLVVHSRDLRDDQPGTASGAVRVIFDHARAGFPGGLRQGTSHRGHDDAVLQLQGPDLSRFKKHAVCHRSDSFLPGQRPGCAELCELYISVYYTGSRAYTGVAQIL